MIAEVILADIISTLPLFTGISVQEKADLLRVARIRRLSRGQILFLQGDSIKSFHIICRGTMQMFRETLDGHEITPDILISGDILCLSEIMDPQQIHQISSRAVDDTVLLEIPMEWLKKNLQNFDHLVLKLFTEVSQRLQKSTLEIEQQTTMSAPQLITCFLHDICVRYNFDPRGFDLPYSKTLIASRLGMELETLSRALPKLQEYGITVKGTHVSFHDMKAVENFVCVNCSAAGSCTQHEKLKQKMQSKPLAFAHT